MIGTKGVPATWGGIERYVEEVGARLSSWYDVTVFGARWYCGGAHGSRYRGMSVHAVPTFRTRGTDALTNGAIATGKAILQRFDIAHFHGFASYLFVPVARLSGIKTVVTTHGIDSLWHSPKWSKLAQLVIRAAFHFGIRRADAVTVVARHLKTKLASEYGLEATVVPCGVDDLREPVPTEPLAKWQLDPLSYLLFIGRIDPIKRVDWLLDIPRSSLGDRKVVIAGGAQDKGTEAYLGDLRRKAEGRDDVVFTGPVGGIEKTCLLQNCLAVVCPSMNEGLPVAVLEGISCGKPAICSDIPAHAELVDNGRTGFLFDTMHKDNFLLLMERFVQYDQRSLTLIGDAARDKVGRVYTWDNAAKTCHEVYVRLLGGRVI